MRRSEPEPHWMDTAEGIWTILSVVFPVVSVVFILHLYFNFPTKPVNQIIVYFLYGYFPAVSVVCLLQLARVKRGE